MKPKKKRQHRWINYTCTDEKEYNHLTAQGFETRLITTSASVLENNHQRAMDMVKQFWAQPVSAFRDDLCMVTNPARSRNTVYNPMVNTLGLEEPFGFNWRANKGSTTNVSTSCATKRGEKNGNR